MNEKFSTVIPSVAIIDIVTTGTTTHVVFMVTTVNNRTSALKTQVSAKLPLLTIGS
jgi:hypothetical protein